MGDDIRYQVDRKARRFLSAVKYHGGEATTTQIRQRTGLSRNETNHRFRRLEELGLIKIGKAESGLGQRDPPKIAILTGKARKHIERGLLVDLQEPETEEMGEDILSELREAGERLDRIEARLDATNESVRSLDEDTEWLYRYVHEWTGTAEPYLLVLRCLAEDKLDADFEERLDEAREEVERCAGGPQ